MVFESVLTEVLNKILGEYVENLDSSQLKVGIWGGDVVLEDLVLKSSALDELDLPVKTVYGRLGKLTLKIPWKRLYVDPVIASVENLFLLVVPNQDIKYDPAKEEKWKQDEKMGEVEKVEKAKKLEQEKDKADAPSDTFVERLAAQIIKNVQITIQKIHVRYEEKYSNPGTTFCVGLTLNSLQMQTIDSWGDPVLIPVENLVFKELTISNFAVYWNSADSSITSDDKNVIRNNFKLGIRTEEIIPSGYKYILGPINATSKLRMNMKPEFDGTNYRVPKILLKMELQTLSVRLSNLQYQDLMCFLETLDLKIKAYKYRKYRPDVPSYKGYYKQWWRFAYSCILEEDVRRRLRNWNWLHIKNHRDLCREYEVAYEHKMQTAKPTAKAIEECSQLEKQLDALNIIIVRQKVETELVRVESQLSKQKTSMWTNWWFGGTTTREVDDESTSDIRKKFGEAITPDEKAKLYRAIGYTEGDVPEVYPPHFVDIDVSLVLNSLEIEILNENIPIPRVLLLNLNEVAIALKKRSSAKAIMINTTISSFTITGCEQNNKTPSLVLTPVSEVEMRGPLLQVFFETNPLDESCDQKVMVQAEPLDIIYDAVTINSLVKVFETKEQPALVQQIQAAAQLKLAEMKEMSTAGLQHLINQHDILDVEILLKSSHIFVPSGGWYEEGKQSLLVLNIGDLEMTTKKRERLDYQKKTQVKFDTEEAALNDLLEKSYDNFILKLTDLQILYVLPGEDWKDSINNNEYYFLKPTTITLEVGKCIIIDDPRLPKLKFRSFMDNVNFTLVENRFIDLMKLVILMPLPESKPAAVMEPQVNYYDSISSIGSLSTQIKIPKMLMTQKTVLDDSNLTQFKLLEFKFEMKELTLSIILSKKGKKNLPLMLFKLAHLEVNLSQQTFDINVSMRLGHLSLVHFFENEQIYIANTHAHTTKDVDLFQVNYTSVKREAPEFHSKYGSVLQLIEVNFTSLLIFIHLEGILELLQWINNFTDEINKLSIDKNSESIATIKQPQEQRKKSKGLSLLDLADSSVKRRRPGKMKRQQDVIDLKVSAHLGEITVSLGSKDMKLLSFGITGGEGGLLMRKAYTQLALKLTGIEMINLGKPPIYSKVISLVDANEALTLKVVIFNEVNKGTGSVNMSIRGNIACLQIVFINKFISSIMAFLDHFQAAQQALLEASQAAAEVARQNVQDVYANAIKVEIDFELKAPIIVVPLNENSYEAFILDLGHLTLNNTFIEVKSSKAKEPAVLDRLKIDLQNMKMSRTIMNEKLEHAVEELILLPISFNLTVQRNLSSGWFTEAPDLEIGCKIEKIHMKMRRKDYVKLMIMLEQNIGNTVQRKTSKTYSRQNTELIQVVPVSMDVSKPIVEEEEVEEEEEEIIEVRDSILTHTMISTKMKFAFNLGSVTIELLRQNETDNELTSGLALFTLYVISIKGSILSDDSIHVSMILLDCIIDDTRPSQLNKINRYMERKKEGDSTEVTPIYHASPERSTATCQSGRKSMIDFTYQQKKKAIFADVRICSFILIINMQYLLEISELFTAPITSKSQRNPSVPTRNTVDSLSVKPSQYKRSPSIIPRQEDVTSNTFNFKCEYPDIILVENMDDIDTNALILHAEIIMKLRVSGDHQIISGSLSDMQLFSCCYNPIKRHQTKVPVLYPLSIMLAGSTPEGTGLHLDLNTTSIKIAFTPGTIQLLGTITSTMITKLDEKTEIQPFLNQDNSNMWNVNRFQDTDYHFLKTELAEEVTEEAGESQLKLKTDNAKSEMCVVSVPTILVTLECGVGTSTIPMILLESSIQATVRNWSTMLHAESLLTLEVCYYNSALALWEPLVEPVDVIKDGVSSYSPWELNIHVETNPEPENTLETLGGTHVETDETLKKALMCIYVSSKEVLPITVTKTCLDVLNALSKEFSEAYYKQIVVTLQKPQFIIKNDCGLNIIVCLKNDFKLYQSDSSTDLTITEVELNPGASVELNSTQVESQSSLDSITKFSQTVDKFIGIKVKEYDCEITLPISRADKRYFKLNPPRKSSNVLETWGLVSEITMDSGCETITLRGIIQVRNHFHIPISVYYMTAKGNEINLVGVINPDSFINLPLEAIYTPTSELFFGVEGYSVTVKPFIWKDLQNSLEKTEILKCTPKNIEDKEPFFLKATGELEQVYYELTKKFTMASTCYNIHIRPTVIFKNLLPIRVVCCIQGVVAEHSVKPGEQIQIPTAEPGSSSLVVRIPDYLDREWSCKSEILQSFQPLNVWTFECYECPRRVTLDLGLHVMNVSGSLILSLYCPFWMLNKTGLMLTYKRSSKAEKESSNVEQADESHNVLYHPENFKGPVMFSFKAKSFFAKKKSQIKVDDGSWSDKFSLDVAGSSGVIECEANSMNYKIGITIQLSYSTLTKQIIFTPYYVIINNFPLAIEYHEPEGKDHWTKVPSKECFPFWPSGKFETIKIRVVDTKESTTYFPYNRPHNSVFKLKNKFGAINVDVQITEGGAFLAIYQYESGMAPALILNHTEFVIDVHDKSKPEEVLLNLNPGEQVLFTWDFVEEENTYLSFANNKGEVNLRQDSIGKIVTPQKETYYWTSFLYGFQRVLLFTKDENIATEAQTVGEHDIISQKIEFNIHGIGISLVDNLAKLEVLHLGITSSGVQWEAKKANKKRYKPLSSRENAAIEKTYTHYMQSLAIGEKPEPQVAVDNRILVDFELNQMLKPVRRDIRRAYNTGFWMQITFSKHLTQFHAKINRIQIDNQMNDCIFPVILSPISPPKSIQNEGILKPFVEVSTVKRMSENTIVQQIKYFKVLIQEFHVKFDVGFLNAMVKLLEAGAVSESDELANFNKDLELVDKPLQFHVSLSSSQEQKNFYDYLHFSPLKIHVSFSLSGGGAAHTDEQSHMPPFLNLLMQSLGVTLTDVQDVILKLAYFEREYSFLTQKQLISETESHYFGQLLKQLYVLVLGLDVIGNPFGLVRGLGQGAADLFYEPFQGAIQGPGEFAEGLVIGVRSLFGHTVGGAAGAVSKITGAMGKGLAVLTFDKDYQKQRRELFRHQPANLQEGLAQSGKGLVMGVVEGVTGVVTKPISGAREKGVEGFFKGFGKGVVGLVTRPTAGLIDFASGSFSAVKKATDLSEDITRMRLPRAIKADGLVRPFSQAEAEGHKILNDLDKGKLAVTDAYVYHIPIGLGKQKDVLLLTDKRLAYISLNEIFGGYQIEWSHTWQEIKCVTMVSNGISVAIDKKKAGVRALFTSNECGKILLIDSYEQRQRILKLIQEYIGKN